MMENVAYGSSFCARCLRRFTVFEDDDMLASQLCVACYHELHVGGWEDSEPSPPNVNDLATYKDSPTQQG